MANYLDLAGTLVGEQILEIGCGLGLAGIVGCQQGGKVLFTDYERDALSLTRYNVWRNGCADRATFVQMDWNAPCVKGKFSLILASDVIYEEKNWRPVLSLIQRRLTTNGQVIFPNRVGPMPLAFWASLNLMDLLIKGIPMLCFRIAVP